jgi:mannose-6-phosphate isomerase-like protein (cupin superfamily)
MQGFVVSEQAVEGSREDGDTAEIRLTIGKEQGSEHLEQKVIRFAPGRSNEYVLEGRQEVVYVVSGRGALIIEGREHELEPDMGAYIGAGEPFRIDNPGPEELLLVAVSLAQEDGSSPPADKRTVRRADRPTHPAGKERRFEYLADEELGNHDLTQFLGVIDPSNVPAHGHVYDEVIYVVEGEGKLHLDGKTTPISTGSCIHLPPKMAHTLENHGPGPMRVLGVFHPAGDPAGRAFEETK